MARPTKTGLDYFAFDVDMFQDLRIRKLIRRKGGQAATVYTVLLCFIYKNGYFIDDDDDLAFIVSEQIGFDESFIREVIDCCIDLGLFDKKMHDDSKVLTSAAIQTRYVTAAKKSKRSSTITDHRLIAEEERPAKVSAKSSAKVPANAPKPAAPQPMPAAQQPSQAQQPHTGKQSIKLETAIEQMWTNRQWVDATCMVHEITPDELSKKLDRFAAHCRAEGKTENPHHNLNDAKSHFNSWLRKNITENAKDFTDRYAKRRGNLLTTASAKEKNWDSTF